MSAPELPSAVDAPRRRLDGQAGQLSYYEAGSGTSLILLHSMNAAGSAYEMKPIFERYRDRYRVYALDWPGFGFSERSQRPYTAGLYRQALEDLLQEVPTPAIVCALSLGCEFAATVALEHPERVKALMLISPTGLETGAARRTGSGSREIPLMSLLFERPPWSGWVYRQLTRPSVIRYFLRRTFGSDQVDEPMVEYDAITARQPGAEHAPLSFLTGRLFSRGLHAVYQGLSQPVWLAHGTKGDFKDFGDAAFADDRPTWTRSIFSTGAMPHFERPAEFFAASDAFLAEVS